MKMITINPNNEVTCTYTNEKYIIAKLLGLLFNKTVAESRHIKRIQYNYNYSDRQTITFIFDNNYKQKFTDVPTSGSLLNDYEIEQLMKGSEQ